MKLYDVIYADPPWSYGDKAMNRGGAERHYTTTSIADLAKLELPASDNCALFMWATMPQIPAALDLMQQWGFSYKTVAFVWVKANKKATDSPFWGMGSWTRANAELCLLVVKGKPVRLGKGVHQLIVEPEILTDPIMQHSRKPGVARDKIVGLLGDVPRLELYARDHADGWDVYGYEAPDPITIPKKTPVKKRKKKLPAV